MKASCRRRRHSRRMVGHSTYLDLSPLAPWQSNNSHDFAGPALDDRPKGLKFSYPSKLVRCDSTLAGLLPGRDNCLDGQTNLPTVRSQCRQHCGCQRTGSCHPVGSSRPLNLNDRQLVLTPSAYWGHGSLPVPFIDGGDGCAHMIPHPGSSATSPCPRTSTTLADFERPGIERSRWRGS